MKLACVFQICPGQNQKCENLIGGYNKGPSLMIGKYVWTLYSFNLALVLIAERVNLRQYDLFSAFGCYIKLKEHNRLKELVSAANTIIYTTLEPSEKTIVERYRTQRKESRCTFFHCIHIYIYTFHSVITSCIPVETMMQK